jgi:hypothetical protein
MARLLAVIPDAVSRKLTATARAISSFMIVRRHVRPDVEDWVGRNEATLGLPTIPGVEVKSPGR